jgi:putative phosphoribosyl transferase
MKQGMCARRCVRGTEVFDDRKDAGRKLARALDAYRGKAALVLAIPRGGVEVGYEVAKHLDADFSIIVARKLPFPDNPEAGFGAVAEDGSTYISEDAGRWLPRAVIESTIARQRNEVERRIRALRKGEPLPEVRGKTVILVDDGIAMGSTMRAAIAMCRNLGARKVVVAVPVTGQDSARELAPLADDMMVLEIPPHFMAVAQVYRNWYDVPDSEVLKILARWEAEHRDQSDA